MTAERARRRGGGRMAALLGALGRSRELTLVAVMIVLSGFVTVRAPNFLAPDNLDQVTALAAIFAIAAVGEALVVLTRNVDLSVESTMGLIAFVVGDVLRQQHLPVAEAWLLGLALALVLGMAN